MQKGFALWFTGLPASGKSTVANIVKREPLFLGRRVGLLDGDELRQLDPEIGFSPEDKAIHIRRVAYVSEVLAKNGVTVLVYLVSPYIHTRAAARELIGENHRDLCQLARNLYQQRPKGALQEGAGR